PGAAIAGRNFPAAALRARARSRGSGRRGKASRSIVKPPTRMHARTKSGVRPVVAADPKGTDPQPAAVDVLFGQAYFLRFDPKLWEARQPYAPLGALYAAACVRDRGYSVALFDAMLAASEAEWADALDRHRPRFAV